MRYRKKSLSLGLGFNHGFRKKGCGCGSGVESLPSMCKAVGLILNTAYKQIK